MAPSPLRVSLLLSCLLPLVASTSSALPISTNTSQLVELDNDRQALLCFKSQLSNPAEVLTSWSNTSVRLCNWHGVTCSTRSPRRVTALDLESEGLMGSIPPCIANLTSLRRLQLSNNSFRGIIPSKLGRLSEIRYLNLSMNSLDGDIPSSLSSCSQLQVLGLWNNSLQGEIPPSLGQCKHLQQLVLSNNKLQGSIPEAFGELPDLQILALASNRLTGEIPLLLGSCSSLRHVDLGRNLLTGSIPASLASSPSLQVLRLMSNSFSGELPRALFNTSSLIAICLQKNSFVGSIPPVIATSPPVKYLSLRENSLTGAIPPSLGNLSSLIFLALAVNNLIGSIPESLGHIPTLQTITLNFNNLTGPVPQSLFNMSSLSFLAIANNSLVGRLPSDIGYTLPNIQTLVLSTNRFDGPIPPSLLNASHLELLYMANNRLTGFVPFFGSLPRLRELDIAYNKLEAGDWAFIYSLSNCTKLTKLLLDSNDLQGNLPSSIGNLSTSLQWLWLRSNKISGPIPIEIGNLQSLTMLFMDSNYFTGSLPPTIGNFHNLGLLTFAQNRLSGRIPEAIGSLVQLSELHLDGNNITGGIPVSIGQCTQLEKLNLSHNSLDGSIPSELFGISTLSRGLDLSYNYLSGQIPDQVGRLINLGILSLSNNKLSGYIPSSLGQCVLLESLQLQGNFLVGSIPQSFIRLVGTKEIDISQNNLSGKIPEFLASLSTLHHLNLSFNDFDGAVPTGGVFSNAGMVSLEGNDRLCTNVASLGLPPCPASDPKKKHKSLVLQVLLPASVFATIILSCVATIILKKRRQSKQHSQLLLDENIKKISYQDIVKATNGFSSANLVGSGSFGTVYKGSLQSEDDLIAIKVFNHDTYGAERSFIAECKALRYIRHRNLVKVITSCSALDSTGAEFRALVFQYMPNGNLDMWLHAKVHEHGKRKALTLGQRISIAVDVAFALDYLHNQCASPLIHCDLKPSNILLDLDMTAHVSDFGLARFLFIAPNLESNSSTCLARLKGSIGYIAPEYGMGEQMSMKGDVYSYGVLLLEMMTGRRPTDEKFENGLSLHEFVDGAFPEQIGDIVDPIMLQGDDINATKVMQNCIIPLVKLGLSCSKASPKERQEMGLVSTEVLAIKQAFLEAYMVVEKEN